MDLASALWEQRDRVSGVQGTKSCPRVTCSDVTATASSPPPAQPHSLGGAAVLYGLDGHHVDACLGRSGQGPRSRRDEGRLGRESCRSAPGYGEQLDPLQPLALVGSCLPWSPSQSVKLGYTVSGSSPARSCLLHPNAKPCTPPHAPPWHPLRSDILGVTLDFIHCYHKLEANTVALIHCEDLRGESRSKQGWAGRGVSLEREMGVTLTFSTVCAVCTGASPSRASTVTWYCPFSEASRLVATL